MALHSGALLSEPATGAPQESDSVVGALTGEHLAIGQARVVVDGDVDMVPARAWTAPHPIALSASAGAARTVLVDWVNRQVVGFRAFDIVLDTAIPWPEGGRHHVMLLPSVGLPQLVRLHGGVLDGLG